MTQAPTLEDLRQRDLVILRRLRHGPLTEFELTSEIVEHSGYTREQAEENIGDWLVKLTDSGLIWSGRLYNDAQQYILAAALTNQGRELVG